MSLDTSMNGNGRYRLPSSVAKPPMNLFFRPTSASVLRQEDAKREASQRFNRVFEPDEPKLLAQTLPASVGNSLPDKVRASVEAHRPASAGVSRRKGRGREAWSEAAPANDQLVEHSEGAGDRETSGDASDESAELRHWKRRALKAEEGVRRSGASLDQSKKVAASLLKKLRAKEAELSLLRSDAASCGKQASCSYWW